MSLQALKDITLSPADSPLHVHNQVTKDTKSAQIYWESGILQNLFPVHVCK